MPTDTLNKLTANTPPSTLVLPVINTYPIITIGISENKLISLVKPIITVIGMGKLGLSMAAIYARTGCLVHGLDLNNKLLDKIRNGEYGNDEPGLKESLRQFPLSLTSNYLVIAESDIVVILVETPIGADGLHNLQPLFNCADMIKSSITNKKPIVCISSTVLPGTAQKVQDILRDKAVVVSLPSLATIGRIFKQLQEEEFSVIIGTEYGDEDKSVARIIMDLWLKCAGKPNFTVTNYTNAELSKILFLVYLNHKVAYGSFISELCEAVPGGDAEVVISAMSKDPRVDVSYMHPGIGAGGPCLPRDTLVLSNFCHSFGVDASVVNNIIQRNGWQVSRIANLIHRLHTDCKIAVLGLTYKPGYKWLEASQGGELAKLLLRYGYSVAAYDFMISNGNHDGIEFYDIKTALNGASIAVLCHNDAALDAALNANLHLMKENNVISVFRHYRTNANYFFIGKNGCKIKGAAKMLIKSK